MTREFAHRFREVYGFHLWTAAWAMFGDESDLPEAIKAPARELVEDWKRRTGFVSPL